MLVKETQNRGMDGIGCITFVLSAGHIWNSLYFTLLTLLRLKCVFSGWIDDPCLWRFSPGAGVLCHGEDYDRWDDIRNVTSSCDVIIQIMALCFPTLSMIHNRWAYYLWRHQTILPVILFFAIAMSHQYTWWHHQMEVFFRVTGPLYGEFTGHQWIPLTKGQ